jgi:predicted RND superfamily exporter protein
LAALTTVLGFGTLLISSHRGLVGLGRILALGVACCMAAALVLLPGVLRLAGKHRAVRREGEAVDRPRAAA